MSLVSSSSAFLVGYTIIVILLFYLAYRNKWFILDHRNLFQQKLFWMVITIPFFSFLAFGLWAWWGHSPELSSAGYSKFYEISKVPLLILAASVPMAAIVNNIHRTIQTEKQIVESEKKNLSDSYYNHFKHAVELFSKIESKELAYDLNLEKFTLRVSNPVSVYKRAFNLSNPESGANYQPSKDFTECIYRNWDVINKTLQKLWVFEIENGKSVIPKTPKRLHQIILVNLFRLENAYENICNCLSLRYPMEKRPVYEIEGRTTYTGLFLNDACLTSSIKELDVICTKILDIINFDEVGSSYNFHHGFLKNNVYLNFALIRNYHQRNNILKRKVSIQKYVK